MDIDTSEIDATPARIRAYLEDADSWPKGVEGDVFTFDPPPGRGQGEAPVVDFGARDLSASGAAQGLLDAISRAEGRRVSDIAADVARHALVKEIERTVGAAAQTGGAPEPDGDDRRAAWRHVTIHHYPPLGCARIEWHPPGRKAAPGDATVALVDLRAGEACVRAGETYDDIADGLAASGRIQSVERRDIGKGADGLFDGDGAGDPLPERPTLVNHPDFEAPTVDCCSGAPVAACCGDPVAMRPMVADHIGLCRHCEHVFYVGDSNWERRWVALFDEDRVDIERDGDRRIVRDADTGEGLRDGDGPDARLVKVSPWGEPEPLVDYLEDRGLIDYVDIVPVKLIYTLPASLADDDIEEHLEEHFDNLNGDARKRLRASFRVRRL